MSGFVPSHSPYKISCISCHLGNNTSFKKDEAHANMLVVPGNLSNVSKTCAKCHLGIDVRVKKSLMNTMSGIISVDKYVFGENNNLDSIFTIHHLKNISNADKHLRNKCASCHIGNEKLHPNPITEKSRGGGCVACHLNYSDTAKYAHNTYINSDKKELPKVHPTLNLQISDKHCFGCHSRSGRISTNYQGWHETIFKDTLYNNPNFRVLADKRVFEKKHADIHYKIGINCIDCHDSYEVMGDGNTYAHQEEAVTISCEDCHFNKNNIQKTISFTNLDEINKRILRLRNKDTIYPFLIAPNSKKILPNVIKKENEFQFIGKLNNAKYFLSKPNVNCTKYVHSDLKCSACHTDWSPQCISCHTSFDTDTEGYDLLDKKWVLGKWQEKGHDFLAEFPTLGVVQNGNSREIKTFSIGMNMYLQKINASKTEFHRYFAPTSAHTIAKKGKSCMDCHNNSVVLGYGRGKMMYKDKKWYFKPKYNLATDGIPLDAWINFLTNDTINKATRINARPFNLAEQKRILRVGACLTCHNKDTKIVQMMLDDFAKAQQRMSKKCQ